MLTGVMAELLFFIHCAERSRGLTGTMLNVNCFFFIFKDGVHDPYWIDPISLGRCDKSFVLLGLALPLIFMPRCRFKMMLLIRLVFDMLDVVVLSSRRTVLLGLSFINPVHLKLNLFPGKTLR